MSWWDDSQIGSACNGLGHQSFRPPPVFCLSLTASSFVLIMNHIFPLAIGFPSGMALSPSEQRLLG